MSKAVVVQNRTRPDAADCNQELIGRVFDELRSVRPRGLRYVVFRLEGGVGFLHMAITDHDEDPLAKSAAFRRFQQGACGRLVGPPDNTSMTIIGSYGEIDPGRAS